MWKKKRTVTIPDGAKKAKLSVIEDLGYTTNPAARSMRSRAKNLVGLIMPAIAFLLAVEVMQGVNRAIAESTLYPLVYGTDDMRRSGSAHTNPRIGRRDERRAVAAGQGVDAAAARALLTIRF